MDPRFRGGEGWKSRCSIELTRNFVLVLLAALVLLCPPSATGQDNLPPLAEPDIVTMLKAHVPPERIADRARARGIDFKITPVVERRLRSAGAGEELLRALREVGLQGSTPTPEGVTVHGDVQGQLQAAQAALEKKDFTAAVKALKSVVEAQPAFTPAWFNLGFAYTALHQQPEAVGAYRKTLELDPNLFAARLNLGILLLEMKQPQAALEDLEKAARLKPDHARAHLYYGRALSLTGKPDDARQEFERALQLDPKLAIAHFDLGQVFLNQKQYPEALAAFQKAAEMDPALPQAELGLALAAEAQDKAAEAATHFNGYLARVPQDQETRFHLARVYLKLGQNEKALECLETVYQAQPGLPGVTAALGDVYALLKKFSESEKFYRRALEAAPNDPGLHRALGQTLLDEEKYPEAESEFRTVLKLDPHSVEAARGLSTSLYLQKRYADTVPLLEALARYPHPPVGLYFVLASCYDHLQDREKALAAYEHFLENSHQENPDQEWQARQRIKLLKRELEK